MDRDPDFRLDIRVRRSKTIECRRCSSRFRSFRLARNSVSSKGNVLRNRFPPQFVESTTTATATRSDRSADRCRRSRSRSDTRNALIRTHAPPRVFSPLRRDGRRRSTRVGRRRPCPATRNNGTAGFRAIAGFRYFDSFFSTHRSSRRTAFLTRPSNAAGDPRRRSPGSDGGAAIKVARGRAKRTEATGGVRGRIRALLDRCAREDILRPETHRSHSSCVSFIFTRHYRLSINLLARACEWESACESSVR